jgi:hypothetical protein
MCTSLLAQCVVIPFAYSGTQGSLNIYVGRVGRQRPNQKHKTTMPKDMIKIIVQYSNSLSKPIFSYTDPM